MAANLNTKMDLEEFYDISQKKIQEMMGGTAKNSAIIFNKSGRDIEFHVYNQFDFSYWIAANKTLILDNDIGLVIASGPFFKIKPNNYYKEEFLIQPNKTYIYRGIYDLKEILK